MAASSVGEGLMSSATEATFTFITLAALLARWMWHSDRQQRFDSENKVENKIMQTRHDMRFVCYLLQYIGVLLASMFAFLVYKLH